MVVKAESDRCTAYSAGLPPSAGAKSISSVGIVSESPSHSRFWEGKGMSFGWMPKPKLQGNLVSGKVKGLFKNLSNISNLLWDGVNWVIKIDSRSAKVPYKYRGIFLYIARFCRCGENRNHKYNRAMIRAGPQFSITSTMRAARDW